MFRLYEHLEDGRRFLFGEYPTLEVCQKITELRWDAMQQLGYEKATFHCEKGNSKDHCVAWIYKR